LRKTVQICPKCKKAGINLYMGGYLGKIYQCNNCGYIGSFFIEMDVEDYLSWVDKGLQ